MRSGATVYAYAGPGYGSVFRAVDERRSIPAESRPWPPWVWAWPGCWTLGRLVPNALWVHRGGGPGLDPYQLALAERLLGC